MSAIAFSSAIEPVPLLVTVSERHDVKMDITENPIESGGVITDHAVLQPKRVTLEVVGKDAAATYEKLLEFQNSRVPFDLVTGLRVYNNMLIKGITADRDKKFANVLRASVELQEVFLVNTAIVSVDVANVANVPQGKSGGTNSTRAANPANAKISDQSTKDRAAGTAQRGDAQASTVAAEENASILSKVFS